MWATNKSVQLWMQASLTLLEQRQQRAIFDAEALVAGRPWWNLVRTILRLRQQRQQQQQPPSRTFSERQPTMCAVQSWRVFRMATTQLLTTKEIDSKEGRYGTLLSMPRWRSTIEVSTGTTVFWNSKSTFFWLSSSFNNGAIPGTLPSWKIRFGRSGVWIDGAIARA